MKLLIQKNKIENLLNWIFSPFITFKIWREKRYLKGMIQEAKRMHLITKKQYHVVPLDDGKLKVVDNDFIRNYNRVEGMKHVNAIDLRKMAVYSTKLDGLEIKLSKLKI